MLGAETIGSLPVEQVHQAASDGLCVEMVRGQTISVDRRGKMLFVVGGPDLHFLIEDDDTEDGVAEVLGVAHFIAAFFADFRSLRFVVSKGAAIATSLADEPRAA